jgi:rubrerythrin
MKNILDTQTEITHQWELNAAKGLCAWICSDCCILFKEGMPKKCPHELSDCTEILQSFPRNS